MILQIKKNVSGGGKQTNIPFLSNLSNILMFKNEKLCHKQIHSCDQTKKKKITKIYLKNFEKLIIEFTS